MAQEKARGALNNKYEIDMIHGPLLGKILLFSLPLMASSVLQLLFNAADVVVVGQFAGPNSLAAVGSTGSVINLLVALFIGISIGTNVLVARYYAMGQDRDVSETVHTSIFLALIGGIIMGAVGIIFSRGILILMASPKNVLELSATYLRIYFAGVPMLCIYNMGAATLRAIGDTRRPLYFLLISGVLNVVLNLFFVISLHMDVAGVALATIISEGVSAVLVIMCLMRARESYHFAFSRLRLTGSKVRAILEIGLPAGLQSMLFSLSNILIQSSINSFGATAMAGSAAAGNLEGFVYMSMDSIYQACITFTSQNYGVRDRARVNRVLRTCLAVVIVVGIVMGNGFYFFGESLLHIYTTDQAAIAYGLERMQVICVTYALCGMMDVVCGSLRGLGYSIVPMIVSLLGACGFRILWIGTYFHTHRTLHVLYLSYPISWILTVAAHIVCFFVIRELAFRKRE